MSGSTRVVDYLPIKEAAKFLTERTGRKFKKLDIFQEAKNGHIDLTAEFLAEVKVNDCTLDRYAGAVRVTSETNPFLPGVTGLFDLWLEPELKLEVIDSELQASRSQLCGLYFKTGRLNRVIELRNDDGTKAKRLPRDARWVVRISSLERYLNPNAVLAKDETLQSRAQAYRSLEWLTLEQASDWIEIISGSAVDDSHLYAMAEFGNCSMYVDASGLKGQTEVKYRPSPQQAVRGLGICQIVTPLVTAGQDTHLYGPAEFIGGHDDGRQETNCSWRISPPQDYEPLFKPEEIEEIARMTTGPGRWSSQTSAIAGAADAPSTAKPADESTAQTSCNSHSTEDEAGRIVGQDLELAPDRASAGKFTQKSTQQEEAIIKALEDLGHTASALPAFEPGVRTVKADVREALIKTRKDLFGSQKVFDRAWDQARAAKKIVNQA